MAAIEAVPPERPDLCGCICETWGHEGVCKKVVTSDPIRLDSAPYGQIRIDVCDPCKDAIARHLARRS